MRAYRIRACTLEDAAMIAHHRVRMFSDMGEVPTEHAGAELLATSTASLRMELERGTYFGWFAVSEANEVVAGVGAHLKSTLPRMSANAAAVIATGPVPLVVNVYTEPQWRKRGLARELMLVLMQWAAERGFDRVVLHASEQARSLYTALGFSPSNEMRWPVRAGQIRQSERNERERES